MDQLKKRKIITAVITVVIASLLFYFLYSERISVGFFNSRCSGLTLPSLQFFTATKQHNWNIPQKKINLKNIAAVLNGSAP